MTATDTAIDNYMLHLELEPDSMKKPVRDLDPTELAEAFSWIISGDIVVLRGGDAARRALFRVDKTGNVSSALLRHDANGRPTHRLVSPLPKLSFATNRFNGIELLYVAGFSKDKAAITSKQIPQDVDPRNLIFLYKLTNMLVDRFSATAMLHIGMVFDPARSEDAHKQGRATDFAGILSPDGELTVEKHWTGQPVVMPSDFNGIKAGAVLPNWPKGFGDTRFRLDSSFALNLNASLDPPRARRLFQSVYDIAVEEITSGGSTSTIGRDSKAIVHPDHPTSSEGKNGREAHHDHMHMQIGPTGDENGPAVHPLTIDMRASPEYLRWT